MQDKKFDIGDKIEIICPDPHNTGQHAEVIEVIGGFIRVKLLTGFFIGTTNMFLSRSIRLVEEQNDCNS